MVLNLCKFKRGRWTFGYFYWVGHLYSLKEFKGKRGGTNLSDKGLNLSGQWIVAARPLCHLQYPVAYLSRLQRILPAARWKF